MELQILNMIQTLRNPLLDQCMPLISNGFVLWILLPLLLMIHKKTRKAGLLILLAMILDVVLCNGILKPLFHRTRPCDVNTAIQLLIHRPTDYSFPSGHTALSFAAVSGLWYSKAYKSWRMPALVFACLIAFSRLYLYVHYPSDVLIGALVGLFCGWLAYKLCHTIDEVYL
jgi:membrane-associated phospholipid phosphatase